MQAERPIGIFDSGVGGLTVARAIRDLLPKEELLYFGDTAHLPYGDRSAALIQQYARQITAFLLEKQCKAIVIACNSASANALDTVQERAHGQAIVLDVIQPIATHIAQLHKGKKIGVIGTKATISSGSYPRALKAAGASNPVATLATPLLAPMIEEGFVNDDISMAVLRRYLERPELDDIDLLVLGCTHYPIIAEDVMHSFGKRQVEVIDPPTVVAQRLQADLEAQELLATEGKGSQQFFVSDLTPYFAQSTRIFFGRDAELTEVAL